MPTTDTEDKNTTNNNATGSEGSEGRVAPAGANVVWETTEAGQWRSGADHLPTSLTPEFMALYGPARTTGMEQMFETYGLPAKSYGTLFVRGHTFDRVVPLIGGDKHNPKLPPKPLLWLATHVHPEFRSRTKTMDETFAPTRRWEAELAAWLDHERDDWIASNLAIQDVDLASLDDGALIDHLTDARTHFATAMKRHFGIKGLDSLPLGDLLALTKSAGIEPAAVVAGLRGASPASGIPPELTTLAEAVKATGIRPSSLEEIRAAGPDASAALDEYLRHFGTRIVTGYDIDGRNLDELPHVVLASVLAVIDHETTARPGADTDAVDAVRARLPEEQRAEFDERFRHALSVYGVRDENGPLTFQWPAGLYRRAYLEAGRRLRAADRLRDPEDVIELELSEVRALLAGANGPTAAEVVERARKRAADSLLTAPATIGPDEPSPPLEVMPASLARGVRAIEAFIEAMSGVEDGRESMIGTGINTTTYRGRAVVALSAEEALVMLEPGDVLVAPCTTPAYNSVLPIVGAVVTEEGGSLCHAAVVARELGMPAVVGALHATTKVNTGDTVEVDPVRGTVSVV